MYFLTNCIKNNTLIICQKYQSIVHVNMVKNKIFKSEYIFNLISII